MDDERFEIETDTPDRANRLMMNLAPLAFGLLIATVAIQLRVIFWMAGEMQDQADHAAQLSNTVAELDTCLRLQTGTTSYTPRERDEECGFASFQIQGRFDGKPFNAIVSKRPDHSPVVWIYNDERDEFELRKPFNKQPDRLADFVEAYSRARGYLPSIDK
ncbi:MAG: hypothetical protein P4L84_36060 [Isosphaeraceae bacterium]|nr:hypothetical protein [Isosphaeraceae bacterium]